MRAFRELETDRDIGMDYGPIPGSEIRSFASYYGLTKREAENFHRIIRILDTKSMILREEKRKKAEEKAKRNQGGTGAGTIIDSW